MKYIPWLALSGFIPETVGFILRWVQTGHFPYWGKYEAYNSFAWAIILFYLLLMLWKPKFKKLGTILLPTAFFLIGNAIITGTTEVKTIPESFLTYWLGVHIAFAKLAFGSALISAYFGLVYIIKERKALNNQPENAYTRRVASLESADYYAYRFAVFAFITLSIMIGAGSIWAYKAWGRYWGWDPVETWSLICWMIYGIILHLRVTMGWRGRKASWLSVIAVPVVIFAFFGMSLIYNTVHEYLAF